MESFRCHVCHQQSVEINPEDEGPRTCPECEKLLERAVKEVTERIGNPTPGPGRPHHDRHRDFEFVDEITIKMVPRYKTSGMSGDEWRVASRVELMFKGQVVGSRSFGDMESAAKLLSWVLMSPEESPEEGESLSTKVIRREKGRCDQVGCEDPATSVYLKKRTYSRDGVMSESALEPEYKRRYRHFCQRHATRGDCGLDDADDNYILLAGPGQSGAHPSDESPSVFGGILHLAPK